MTSRPDLRAPLGRDLLFRAYTVAATLELQQLAIGPCVLDGVYMTGNPTGGDFFIYDGTSRSSRIVMFGSGIPDLMTLPGLGLFLENGCLMVMPSAPVTWTLVLAKLP